MASFVEMIPFSSASVVAHTKATHANMTSSPTVSTYKHRELICHVKHRVDGKNRSMVVGHLATEGAVTLHKSLPYESDVNAHDWTPGASGMAQQSVWGESLTRDPLDIRIARRWRFRMGRALKSRLALTRSGE
jgi:hypothetical protein